MPDTENSNKTTVVVKYDAGKSPIWQGVFAYFPSALKAVADISGFGAKKYSWGGWKNSASIKDIARFENALGRHLVNEHADGMYDPESGLLHAAHAAWNALAKLELLLDGGVPMVNPGKADQNATCQDIAGSKAAVSYSGECVEAARRTSRADRHKDSFIGY